MSRTPDDEVETTLSDGNVFADLGLPRADERLRLAEYARMMPKNALPDGWRWCINPDCPMHNGTTPIHAHQIVAATPEGTCFSCDPPESESGTLARALVTLADELDRNALAVPPSAERIVAESRAALAATPERDTREPR